MNAKALFRVALAMSALLVVACGRPPRSETSQPLPEPIGGQAHAGQGGSPSGSDSSLQPRVSPCVSDAEKICGPFPTDLVALCVKFSTRDSGGASVCHGNRWARAFHASLVAHSKGPSSNGPSAFLAHYQSDYTVIKRIVEDEHGLKENGCAAFLSTALARSGLPVAYETWAQSLADDLENKHGFLRIAAHADLQPGDVVVTQDQQTKADRTTPHVFVFIRFGASKDEAISIDNQGKELARNLTSGGPKSRFWYGLRIPHMKWGDQKTENKAR